jgi:hypothetical protein
VEETDKRKWDVRLSLAGTLATLLTILIGVWQFNAGERSRTELEYQLLDKKDFLETKRQLWLQRVEGYRSIAEISGRLVAQIDNKPGFAAARIDFEKAYWGVMILVEEKPVERAMIDLRLELKDYAEGNSARERVMTQAKTLLDVCRASVEKGPPKA